MNLLGTILSVMMALTPPTLMQDVDVSRQYVEEIPCAIVSTQEVRADYQVVDENGATTYQTNNNTASERTIPTRPSTTRNSTYQKGNYTNPTTPRNGNYVRGSVNNATTNKNGNVTYKNDSSVNNNGNLNNSNVTRNRSYTRDTANNGNYMRNEYTPRTLELSQRDYANANIYNENGVKSEIISYYNQIAEHKGEIAILRAKARAKAREYEESLYKNHDQNSTLSSNYYEWNYVR